MCKKGSAEDRISSGVPGRKVYNPAIDGKCAPHLKIRLTSSTKKPRPSNKRFSSGTHRAQYYDPPHPQTIRKRRPSGLSRAYLGFGGMDGVSTAVYEEPGPPTEPKIMAQYPKIESIGSISIGSSILALLEVQEQPESASDLTVLLRRTQNFRAGA